MPEINKFLSKEVFDYYESQHKVDIAPIVTMDTADGTDGSQDILRHTGVDLCEAIAGIKGLPEEFVNRVNGNYSIKSEAFSKAMYVGSIMRRSNSSIDRTHRVVVCNALNEIKVLLTTFKNDPNNKYSWKDVFQQTVGYEDGIANCAGGIGRIQ